MNTRASYVDTVRNIGFWVNDKVMVDGKSASVSSIELDVMRRRAIVHLSDGRTVDAADVTSVQSAPFRWNDDMIDADGVMVSFPLDKK